MQRKQVEAMRRKSEAMDNHAPRLQPAQVQRVQLDGDLSGMGVICEPEDWNQVRNSRVEARKQGS